MHVNVRLRHFMLCPTRTSACTPCSTPLPYVTCTSCHAQHLPPLPASLMHTFANMQHCVNIRVSCCRKHLPPLPTPLLTTTRPRRPRRCTHNFSCPC
jgi:hypothetical protein